MGRHLSVNTERNGYLAGRKGGRDACQEWVKNLYRTWIRQILVNNPAGLRHGEIVEKAVEVRTVWQEHNDLLRRVRRSASSQIQARIYRQIKERNPPKGKGISSKIVRKHLNEMIREKDVVKIGDRYVLLQAPQPCVSDALNEKVTEVIGRKPHSSLNFILAPAAAGCYLLGQKEASQNSFYEDILESKARQFEENLFWLDNILESGIKLGYFSEDMFSVERNWLDAGQLRKGWKRCFNDSGLLVLAFAIQPTKFLEFLTGAVGKAFAANYLNERWQSIVTHANEEKKKWPTEEEIQRLKKAGRLADEKIKQYQRRTGGM